MDTKAIETLQTPPSAAEPGGDAAYTALPHGCDRQHTEYLEGEKPPVIILNMFYSGLGIARDLRDRNIRILGLSADPTVCGSFTRSCEVRIAPDSQEQPEQLLAFLLLLANEFSGAIIFPTRDADVVFLDGFRSSLERHFRLGIPPNGCLTQVMDKSELICVARQASVSTPKTIAVHHLEELARVPAEVGFPCVVKPVSSFHWRQGGSWERVGARKAFRAENAEQLTKEYKRVSLVHPSVLVQEWIAGCADQIVVLGGYVDQNSEPLGYFTARKIVQSPDDFGTGCVVQSEDIPELLEPTIRLLKALRYQGMAEVEYKQDKRTGEYKLIEINTRHWDQHQLGGASGVNLTWTAYCHLVGRPLKSVRTLARQVKWVAEDGFILYVLHALSRGQISLTKICRILAGRRMYAIFTWNDPRPLLRYLLYGLLPLIGGWVSRRIRGEIVK